MSITLKYKIVIIFLIISLVCSSFSFAENLNSFSDPISEIIAKIKKLEEDLECANEEIVNGKKAYYITAALALQQLSET